MSSGFWNSVFAVGIVQGVFLAVALCLQKSGNRRATRTLALIVLVFSAMISSEVLEELLPTRIGLLLVALNVNTELAIGPLFLLFFRFALAPQRFWRFSDALHFLPLAVGLCGWFAAWVALLAEPAVVVEGRLAGLARNFVIFKACYLLAYAVATYRTLEAALTGPARFAAGRQKVGLAWMKKWLLGLCVVPGVIYGLVLLEAMGVELALEPDQAGGLLLALMIYLASLLVLLRPWVLALKVRPEAVERWSKLSRRLTHLLEVEKPWLDPELSLGELAEAMSISQKKLSAALNEGMDTTFYALITSYRLAEFERLAKDPMLQERPVLDLAFEAGFNSKASFYRAVREGLGTTPVAYRKSVVKESLSRDFSSQTTQ